MGGLTIWTFDWVPAGPAVDNVAAINAALDNWVNQPMSIAMYDEGDQQNGYHICGFANLVIEEYNFTSVPKWLRGNFVVGAKPGLVSEDATDYGLRDVRLK